jgi:hypothetical protein
LGRSFTVSLYVPGNSEISITNIDKWSSDFATWTELTTSITNIGQATQTSYLGSQLAIELVSFVPWFLRICLELAGESYF